MRKVWINLYQQGWYHREGKAGTLPYHAGDTYPTEQLALADIDREAPYLGTVSVTIRPIDLNDAGRTLLYSAPYPEGSEPVPLRETRAIHQLARAAHEGAACVPNDPWTPALDAGVPVGWPIHNVLAAAAPPDDVSIETSEGEALPRLNAGQIEIQHPSPTTVADWINMCRRPGGY